MGRNKKPEKNQSQLIKLPCLDLYSEPGVMEVDLESSTKIGSEKINKLRKRRKKTTKNKFYSNPGLTNKSQALREVVLESSAKNELTETTP